MGIEAGHEIVNDSRTILSENDDDHDLSGGGGTDHDVAHKAYLLALVVEFQSLLLCILFGPKADGVAWFGLKVAMVNVEDFVEAAGDVEAECVHGTPLVVVHIDGIKPAAVGIGVLQFVAVVGGFFGGQNGKPIAFLYLTDALKGIFYLLGFEFELAGVAEVLPFATSAGAKMGAESGLPVWRGLEQAVNTGFGEGFFVFFYEYIDDIAGDTAFYKIYLIVYSGDALAFGGHIEKSDFLQDPVSGFSVFHPGAKLGESFEGWDCYLEVVMEGLF